MTGTGPDAQDRVARTLQVTRSAAAGLAFSTLLLAALSGFLPIEHVAGVVFLAGPVALAGLVSPVVGYRLFLWRRERLDASADPDVRCAGYMQATILSLSITEGIALLGIVVFLLTGRAFPLVGVVTHTLLTGAIWPSRERVEAWLA